MESMNLGKFQKLCKIHERLLGDVVSLNSMPDDIPRRKLLRKTYLNLLITTKFICREVNKEMVYNPRIDRRKRRELAEDCGHIALGITSLMDESNIILNRDDLRTIFNIQLEYWNEYHSQNPPANISQVAFYGDASGEPMTWMMEPLVGGYSIAQY